MMTVDVALMPVLAGVGVLLGVVVVWRAGRRRARAAAEATRAGVRLVSLAGRVLVTGALLLGVQWVVITHPGDVTLLVVVLGVPDLFAGYVLTRALTVSIAGSEGRGRGERR